MALTYGFYNAELKNGKYDRSYNAEDFGAMFDGIISDGVFRSYGNAFKVTKTSDKTFSVGTGRAWFNGTWTCLDEATEFAISSVVNAPLYIVSLSIHKKARTNTLSVYPSGTSVSMTKDDTYGSYEYCLAYVYVSGGVITKVESHIGQGSENVTPYAEGLLGGSSSVLSNVKAASYTTGILFKANNAFDLTFKTENGLSYKNSFSVATDKSGKITIIKNETAGRSITVGYESE